MSVVHVSFQFNLTGSGIFFLQPEKGVIAPQSMICVKVYFEPGEAANYYKRIFCIIQDCHPLYCDLVGCCFRDKVDFPTLQLSHLSKHRDITAGDASDQIHELDTCTNTGDEIPELSNCPKLISSLHEVVSMKNKEKMLENSLPDSSVASWHEMNSSVASFGNLIANDHPRKVLEQACTTDDVWEEYFFGKVWSSVDVGPRSIDFGTISCMQTEKRSISIRNNSQISLSCFWYILEVMDDTNTPSIVLSKGPWTTKKPSHVFSHRDLLKYPLRRL
jgi:hypothetical protein